MADKEEKKNKKVVGFKEFDSAKYVELEPTIEEARSAAGTAVVSVAAVVGRASAFQTAARGSV